MLILLLLLIIAFLLWMLLSRKKTGVTDNKDHLCDPNRALKNFREDQYILNLKPGIRKADLEAELKAKFGEQVTFKHCECDTLILVSGLAGVGEIAAAGDPPLEIKPAGVAAGDGIDGANGAVRNFKLKEFIVDGGYRLDDLKKQMGELLQEKPSEDGDPLIIAVLDTGLDADMVATIKDYLWSNSNGSSPCYKEAEYGWDFVNGNKNPNDDHPKKHGTMVTSLILQQVVGLNVKIMPLKVLNSVGHGELFDILCAIQFAKKHGAKILNMSLGGYADDISYPLYERVLNELEVSEQSPFLVAAAGNIDPNADAVERTYTTDHNLRNLTSRRTKFYPAVYSKCYKNIITVTTVTNEKEGANVCPRQNYSPEFVNVGTYMPNTVDCEDTLAGIKLSGSSFATPIISGKLARYLISTGITDNDKNEVLSHISPLPMLTEGRIQKKKVWGTTPTPVTYTKTAHTTS